MQKKHLWDEVKGLWPDTFVDNFWLLLYTLLGGLAPLYLSWGIKAFRTESLPNVTEFAQGGEFALYAAAMAAPSLYLLSQDRKRKPFPARPVLVLTCVILMLLAVGGYMLVAQEVLTGTAKEIGIIKGYAWATIGLFAVSTLFAYVIAILDATRVNQDIRKTYDAPEDDMSRRINDLPA